MQSVTTGETAAVSAREWNRVPTRRLVSLDALRGFDMFWIIGGEDVVQSLSTLTGWRWLATFSRQLEHPLWDGFTCYDLIFPLFLFISGVAMPFSLLGRLERGDSRRAVYWRIVRRTVLLVFLGMIYNGFLKFDWHNTRYPSVLGRIGLAYGFAAIIVINSRPRGQFLWMIGLLLGYWAAMTLIPVPGYGAGALSSQHGTLAGYIDRTVLPGRLYRGDHDPEGLLSTVPSISTALLGALAGYWLRSARRSGTFKTLVLIGGGLLCLALALLWAPWFHINKNLWSSSFMLFTGGWSLLLLALFYYIIDVRGWQRWAFFFVVIGVNPLTIYIAEHRLIDFELPVKFLLGGALKAAPVAVQAAIGAVAVLAVKWLFLLFLYRKKVFLRV